MNWLWSQVFQGSVKNVFAVSVPSLTLAGTVDEDHKSGDKKHTARQEYELAV